MSQQFPNANRPNAAPSTEEPRTNLWRLPNLVSVAARRVTYPQPRVYYVGTERRQTQQAVELQIETNQPIPVRAVTPVLLIGKVPIADYSTEGTMLYRFVAYEPDRLAPGAVIRWGWPGSPKALVATSFRFSLSSAPQPVASAAAAPLTRTVVTASDSGDDYTVVHSAADGEAGVSISEDDGRRAPTVVSPFPPSAFADPLIDTDQKLKDAFSAAIATVKANAAYAGLPNVDALPIILVALNDDGTRPFAGAHVRDMFYSGSLLKIAAMYGAFQLRHAVNALAATLDPAKVKDTKTFFRAVHNAFDAKILNAPDLIRTSSTAGNRVPRYEDIFTASQDASGAWSVHFHGDTDPRLDFDGHLQKTVVFSHNPSAGYVIQKLGFSWIDGLLQKAGLFRPAAKNGIWLAGDYLNPQKMINDEHAKQVAHDADPGKPAGDPDSVEEFNLGISGWATVNIHSENDNDVKQVTTCIDVARLFVLLFDSKLVDNYLGSTMDLSNGDMSSLLRLAVESTGAPGIDNAPSLIGRVPLTAFSITWSKIGVGDLKRVNGGDKIFSEAMLVHETAGKRRNFVVVWQNVKLPTNLDPLARIRDIIQKTMGSYNP
jgi:hypothetical protein